MKTRAAPNLFLIAVGGPMALAKGENDGTLYRKELAYPGRFVKMADDNTPEFELEVTEPLIDHWVNTFAAMDQNRVEVPVPLGHVTDPEKKRGKVVKLSKELNDDGVPALFAYIKFRDASTAKELKDSNVSLFMPPKWTDGTGVKYNRPITHVAITDYPVIPGLAPFERVGKVPGIAAGFEIALAQEQEDDMPMTVEELAKRMGIECAPGEDPAECILQAWEEGGEGGDGGDGGDGKEIPGSGEGEGYGNDGEFDGPRPYGEAHQGVEYPESGHEVGDDVMAGIGSPYDPPPAMGFDQAPVMRLPPTVVRSVAASRVAQINALVPRIGRKAADELKKQYCGVEHVGIALSMEAADPTVNDGFDQMIRAMSMVPSNGSIGEQSGQQVRVSDPNASPLVIDAQRRAQAARGDR